MRIWGCPAYMKYIESDKFRAKSDKCLFVGYPKEKRGCYFYNPQLYVIRSIQEAHNASIKVILLGFPRVYTSYTRWNNSNKIYIHQIMPWIAFKNFKRVQVTYFVFQNFVLRL